MPILDNEIVWRPSALVSDSTPAQNGGRMAAAQAVSGVKNNLLPDVTASERAAGAVKWRKAFIHVASAIDAALVNARLFLDALTPGGDFVTVHAGTQTDTEDQVTARGYGVGTLNVAATAGAESIQVLCENLAAYTTLQPFRTGDAVRISDKPSVGGSGNEEWKTLTGIVYGGSYATLSFTGSPLVHSYATNNTLVSSVMEAASVAAAFSAWVETSTAGTYAEGTAGNVVAHNKGAIQQIWTLTFTSPTAFTASGDTVGALAAGGIAADYAPLNPATGTPYFTIQSEGWGGTWAANDTVVFNTAPASIPVWYRREVPAGAASLANDYASLAIHGESAS
jgi:hypothetical protein